MRSVHLIRLSLPLLAANKPTAQDYLTRELNAITTDIGNRYYLDNETANHPASGNGGVLYCGR